MGLQNKLVEMKNKIAEQLKEQRLNAINNFEVSPEGSLLVYTQG